MKYNKKITNLYKILSENEQSHSLPISISRFKDGGCCGFEIIFNLLYLRVIILGMNLKKLMNMFCCLRKLLDLVGSVLYYIKYDE